MATSLLWYPTPPVNTRCGMHDSNGSGDNPPDLVKHAAEYARYGIRWAKLLANPTEKANEGKVQRAKILWQHGVMPIVRLYVNRPHPDWVPTAGQIKVYTDALGIPVYVEAGNEPNLTVEQSRSLTPEMVAQQFAKAAHFIKLGGGIPVTYALSPGGNIEHRTFTTRFLDELLRIGGTSALDGCAYGVHPRPHTFPPDTEPSSTVTVAFNEWKWHADQLKARFGWVPPMLFTEHGYSLNDSTNTGHPPITEPLWVSYNEELFRRGAPDHPKSLPEYVFAMCYWKEIGGGWYNDNAFNGWLPAGATAWGQRILTMGINWHYSLADQVPLDALLIDDAKHYQLISPNPDAALEKAAWAHGYRTALSNEREVTHNGKAYVRQLFYRQWVGTDGKRRAAERVYYVLKGDWANVKYYTVFTKVL